MASSTARTTPSSEWGFCVPSPTNPSPGDPPVEGTDLKQQEVHGHQLRRHVCGRALPRTGAADPSRALNVAPSAKSPPGAGHGAGWRRPVQLSEHQYQAPRQPGVSSLWGNRRTRVHPSVLAPREPLPQPPRERGAQKTRGVAQTLTGASACQRAAHRLPSPALSLHPSTSGTPSSHTCPLLGDLDCG